ncbi:MAG: site-specific DNA-methyltransferase [Myxococcales bacterium]|nr:site-specific DNA-methyltransferase [Myxococcales bacterium]
MVAPPPIAVTNLTLPFAAPTAPAVEPDVVVHGDSAPVAAAHAGADLALIYVDPPFGTDRIQRGRAGRYADDGGDPDAHVAWLSPWLAASRDALAATGSLVVHLDWRAVHYAKVALDRLFGADCFAGEIVWCYAIGGKSRRGFGRKHDTLLWYGRTPRWAFYPDQVRVPRRGGSHMKVEHDEDGRPVQIKRDRKTGRVYRYPVADGKVPEDWWTDIETLNRADRERTGWPSQKPQRLLERLVSATTVPGDRVADWFAGAGTTAAAAQRLGRRFVVAEAAADAVAHIRARLTAQAEALAAVGTPPPPVDFRVA